MLRRPLPFRLSSDTPMPLSPPHRLSAPSSVQGFQGRYDKGPFVSRRGTSDRIVGHHVVDSVVAMTTQAISILPESECWQLLSRSSLGRLVTSVDGHPEIFPVNFVVQHRSVLFRTAEGTKLVSAVINNDVLFEADDHNAVEGWSVIVRGTARTLRTAEEIGEAERAQLLPWTATVKQHYVRIRPTRVTGRRFAFGSEPDREFTVV